VRKADFFLIAILNADSVECGHDVHDSHPLHFGHAGECLLDGRRRISILLGDRIQCSVVNADAQTASRFLDNEDGCGIRRCTWSDVSFAHHLVDVGLDRFGFSASESVDFRV
jgi:hypothetical protein